MQPYIGSAHPLVILWWECKGSRFKLHFNVVNASSFLYIVVKWVGVVILCPNYVVISFNVVTININIDRGRVLQDSVIYDCWL